MAYPHNIHHKPIGITTKDGQFGHPHWEDDMAHNYAHGLSMFDHVVLPATILLKVGPFEHANHTSYNHIQCGGYYLLQINIVP